MKSKLSRTSRREIVWAGLAILLTFPVSFGVAYLESRSRPQPASEQDAVPGRDIPFTRIRFGEQRELTAAIVAHYVSEAAQFYQPPFEAGRLFIRQPELIPAGWAYDTRGAGPPKTVVKGDWVADVAVDLLRSRFSAGRSGNKGHSYMRLCLSLLGPGDPGCCVYFIPSQAGYPNGWIANSVNDEFLFLRPGIRTLSLRLLRRREFISAWASADGEKARLLFSWLAAAWPLYDLGLEVRLDRPAQARKDEVFQAPGKDVYAVSAFTLTCIDARGCTIRIRN